MFGSLFNKVGGFQASNFTKMRFQCRCFPVNITKFFKNNFFYRTPPVAASGKIYFQKLSEICNRFYEYCN